MTGTHTYQHYGWRVYLDEDEEHVVVETTGGQGISIPIDDVLPVVEMMMRVTNDIYDYGIEVHDGRPND